MNFFFENFSDFQNFIQNVFFILKGKIRLGDTNIKSANKNDELITINP